MALTRITKGVIKPNENYDTHNINSTGIVTAIGLDVNGNADVSGSLSVGGVLTYEDVTSIDSVGIITARSGVDVDDFVSVGSNIHLGNAGVITATSFVGSGAALTGIDATAIKDSGGNVKVQAQASGAVYTGIHTFNSDLDVDGHTNLDNVSVAGVTTMSGNLTITNTSPTINFTDSNHNSDFRLQVDGGIFKIRDITNSNATRFELASDGTFDFYGNVDCNSGIDVTGNANISGDLDVDGHTNLDNLSIAGVSTFAGTLNASTVSSTALIASGDLDVDGHTNLDNVSIAGVTTFNGLSTNDVIRVRSADSNGNCVVNILSEGTTGNSRILFSDTAATSGDGWISYSHNDRAITFTTAGTSNERLRIDSSGRLGIQGAPTRALLEVRASGGSNTMLTALWGANEGTTAGTLSDNTDKAVRMGIHHYDTDALPYGLLVGSSTNGVNNLTFGGGTSLMNAATEIKFNTAANQTTTSGTERLRIASDGRLTSTRSTTTAYSATATTNDSSVVILNSGAAGHATLQFQSLSGGSANTGQATVSAFNESSGSKNTALTFGTRQNSDATVRERLRITSAGILLAGHTSSPTSDADKIQAVSTAGGTGICLHNYSASAYGNQIAFMKSRNNTIGSNTILNSGDRIGELNFYGNDGSGRSLGAQIQVMADGTQGNDNSPSRINLRTGTNQSMSTRLAVHPAGTVGVSKGGYANSDHSMSLTVNTGTDLTDGLMIISNYNSGNQNSDSGKLMFCGHGQTNGVYMYKDNEVSWGKGALVFHTKSTANSYSTQLEETARFTAYGRFGLGTGGPGQNTVDSLMHIQGNSDNGDEACQLTIEDEDTSSGSKIPSIQFKGNGVNTGRIRGTDAGGITFATWNGSSQIQRSIIGNHAEGGAFLLNADDRGWATFRHSNNQGLRTHIRQHYAPGNAVQTRDILRIRRHNWGWGTYKITLKALYYYGSQETTYYVNGHGAGGGDNYSIVKETAHNNDWSGATVTKTSASTSSPGNSSTSYIDVRVNIPNYMYMIVYIEAYSSGYSTDPTNIGSDAYCLL